MLQRRKRFIERKFKPISSRVLASFLQIPIHSFLPVWIFLLQKLFALFNDFDDPNSMKSKNNSSKKKWLTSPVSSSPLLLIFSTYCLQFFSSFYTVFHLSPYHRKSQRRKNVHRTKETARRRRSWHATSPLAHLVCPKKEITDWERRQFTSRKVVFFCRFFSFFYFFFFLLHPSVHTCFFVPIFFSTHWPESNIHRIASKCANRPQRDPLPSAFSTKAANTTFWDTSLSMWVIVAQYVFA